MEYDINYWSVLAAAVAQMIIGFIWYSDALLGKQWRKEMGISDAKGKKMQEGGMAKMMGLGFVGALLMAYVFSFIIVGFEHTTLVEGIYAGFWAWLGFIVPLLLGNVLWGGQSWKLWLINATYWLTTLAVMGAILAVWQ